MFFVYVYFHPTTGIPFYVGKGTGDRDQYHWWNKNNHYNTDLGSILQELQMVGQRPTIIRVLHTDDESIAYTEECAKILEYGRIDLGTGSLCNKTPGGEGFGNTGTTWSTDQHQKRNQRYIENSPGVGFTQYDIDGNQQCTYKCARELRDAGYTTTQIMAIRCCCKGTRFSVAGFRWSYSDTVLSNSHTTMKRIRQFTKLGEFVSEFMSVAEASRSTGINQGDIAGVARGNSKLKTAGGFVWKYLPD